MATLRNSRIRTGLADVNGTSLYYEMRGHGPSLLFISGATGDAGHYERVAGSLADEFTVVTYDRRGNSRSPRPVGWKTTSPEEQSEDAAALIKTLRIVPAAVFGSSGRAVIALWLVLGHPELVRGVILHEPPLFAALKEPDAPMGMIRPLVESGMATGGSRGGVEAFVRFVAGEANYLRLDPEMRERMLGNGETFFGAEFGALEARLPEEAALSRLQVPSQVLVGEQSPPFFAEAAEWLANHTGILLRRIPGTHAPYLDRPADLDLAIRPFFRSTS